jgi:hypothetical protein
MNGREIMVTLKDVQAALNAPGLVTSSLLSFNELKVEIAKRLHVDAEDAVFNENEQAIKDSYAKEYAKFCKELAASSNKAVIGQSDAKSGFFKTRLPYLFLAPASLSILFFLIQAGQAASAESSFIHNVGLFTFPGAASVAAAQCSSLSTRTQYFLLHLQMSLLISIICKANRSTTFGIPAIVRRVVFFSLGYAAVGMAAPILLVFTGDAGILDDPRVHSPSSSPVDDSDFDTYSTIFVSFGWFLASHMIFGITTCSDEYSLTQATTVFDYSVIVWASCLLLPLLFYVKRAMLPVFWRRFGFMKPGSGYLGLALMNGLFVCAFAIKELVSYNPRAVDGGGANFVSTLAPWQQLQFSNNRTAAFLDYVFMTLTMSVFVLRHVGWPGITLAFGVLLCPPVALPLFLSRMSASHKLK